jgi:kanamycin nucleotidyltransferase
MILSWGPQSLPHTQRLIIAHEIAERVKERFHPEVIAIGLYGSLAREEDGPYSDIELFGVLRTDQYEQRYEWCTAKWKAEVDLYGVTIFFRGKHTLSSEVSSGVSRGMGKSGHREEGILKQHQNSGDPS